MSSLKGQYVVLDKKFSLIVSLILQRTSTLFHEAFLLFKWTSSSSPLSPSKSLLVSLHRGCRKDCRLWLCWHLPTCQEILVGVCVKYKGNNQLENADYFLYIVWTVKLDEGLRWGSPSLSEAAAGSVNSSSFSSVLKRDWHLCFIKRVIEGITPRDKLSWLQV